jgi:hypothetical protein
MGIEQSLPVHPVVNDRSFQWTTGRILVVCSGWVREAVGMNESYRVGGENGVQDRTGKRM